MEKNIDILSRDYLIKLRVSRFYLLLSSLESYLQEELQSKKRRS